MGERRILQGLVAAIVPPDDLGRVEDLITSTAAELQEIERQRALASGDDPPTQSFGEATLDRQMAADGISFSTCSEALNYCSGITDAARRRLAEIRQAEAKEQQKTDDARQRSAPFLEAVSLKEWHALDDATKETLLPPDTARVSASHFDKNVTAMTELATYSWDPITGCEHTCSYCSAREIATSKKKAKDYPYAFAPTLRPTALLAPRLMHQPLDGVCDPRDRNVITGWMADIFGPWVPGEWIAAVLSEIRNAPNWNFLCLTKFPKRMAEFDIPPNMWMGATVDLQARIAETEAAFAKIGSKVKWLCCEPLLDPLQFGHMDRFDWIVIGGANGRIQSSQTA
jgi:protein gp37